MKKLREKELRKINGGASPKTCGAYILGGALTGMGYGATGGIAGIIGGAHAGAVIGTLGCFKD